MTTIYKDMRQDQRDYVRLCVIAAIREGLKKAHRHATGFDIPPGTEKTLLQQAVLDLELP